jgi:hypothetical protein
VKRGLAVMLLVLAACGPEPSATLSDSAQPNAAGLVTLPCGLASPKPANVAFCRGRNYVTPAARAVIMGVASTMARRYPGFVLYYMDASGADGHVPFAPHLSHGDGREVDLALVYDGPDGQPLGRPPTVSGYFANINPRPGDPLPCKGVFSLQRKPDRPPSPDWRLDEARSRDLVLAVLRNARVKRIFLEPHLKARLGLSAEPKVHFQGCWAARHDDHIHVDVL